MPVELWLTCICKEALPGEELVAVGSHPALGRWNPSQGVVLRTSSESYPRWEVQEALRLAEDPTSLPARLEYKYLLRRSAVGQSSDGRDGDNWEDLGMRSVPTFRGIGGWEVNALPWQLEPRPVNRLLHLPAGHGLALRIDTFGVEAAVREAIWHVSPSWAPDVAGAEALVGARCGLGAVISWPRPRQKDDGEGAELDQAAHEVFVKPKRAKLLVGLMQLSRSTRLPGGLWQLVWEHLGGDLVAPQTPTAKVR